MKPLGLIPRRRLLAALLVGAALIGLGALEPVAWIAAAVYHALLLGLLTKDALRLPSGGYQAGRSLPHPFSLGAEQVITVTVFHPAAAGLSVRVADHCPLELAPGVAEVEGRFDPEGRLLVTYGARASRRGDYAFGPVELRCWNRDGWWVRQVRLPLADKAEVFPDVLSLRRHQLSARRGLRLDSGLRRARPPGATAAFAGLREYQPGDEVRRIDWKVTARRDHPVTVQVEAERGQQLVIALDCGRLMRAPAGHLTKHDHAVNAALLLAWVAQAAGDRVGLAAFSDRLRQFVDPRPGSRQMARLASVLRTVEAGPVEPDFRLAFAQLARRLNRRSLVVMLTDVLDQETSRDLVQHALWLGRRHLLLVVAMADPDLLQARLAPVDAASAAYRWAATEEILDARRESFERLRRGGVLGLDVEAGRLSPALVERYLELKERALL